MNLAALPTNGTANLGGGGGGKRSGAWIPGSDDGGANGGDGVVILEYILPGY